MKKNQGIYIISSAILLISLGINVSLGTVQIPLKAVYQVVIESLFGVGNTVDIPSYYETIVWQLRVPHALLICLTGAALAGSGATFQGLFRNPLADPYLIGIASGAGLGAIIAINFNVLDVFSGYYLVPISGFAGAILTVYIVYFLAKVDKVVPITTLILAGVAVGAFTSSINSLILLRSNQQFFRSLSYLFGGGIVSGWDPLLGVSPYILLGLGVMTLFGHQLNVLQLGDEQTKQLGLSPEKIKGRIIFVASITTAAAVSFSGIIGFVGLIAPHIVRVGFSSDYKHVIPLSIIIGATGLLLADVIARILFSPQSLPVGIITAFIGAPFFLWILRKAKKEVYW